MIRQLWYEFRMLIVTCILDLLLFVAPKEKEGVTVIRGVYDIAKGLTGVGL